MEEILETRGAGEGRSSQTQGGKRSYVSRKSLKSWMHSSFKGPRESEGIRSPLELGPYDGSVWCPGERWLDLKQQEGQAASDGLEVRGENGATHLVPGGTPRLCECG